MQGTDRAVVRDLLMMSRILEPRNSQVGELIQESAAAFSTSSTDLGHGDSINHKYPTADAIPFYRVAYRIPHSKRGEMDREMNKLLDGVIPEHTTSPWGDPRVVRREDRWVVPLRPQLPRPKSCQPGGPIPVM